jgi:quinolinate synthase
MKENTLTKLMYSLWSDRIEIILCDDCCDPKSPHQDEWSIHIQRSIANKARAAIDRMLSIG